MTASPNKQDFDLRQHQEWALSWLIRSCEVQGGAGSSAFYARWRHWKTGWAPAYPETTGYLIPTLLHYQTILPALEPAACARQCYDWLLTLADEAGGYSSLYAHSRTPSLFNSAQILLGLLAYQKEYPSELGQHQVLKTTDWCLRAVAQAQEPIMGLYHPGYLAAYYIRAIWPIALALQSLGRSTEWSALDPILAILAKKIQPDGQIMDAGFAPGASAYLHTIAYTIRGWWELGDCQNDAQKKDRARSILAYYWAIRQRGGRWPGAIHPQKGADWSFLCLPGLAQMAIILHKIGTQDHQPAYVEEARQLVRLLGQYQKKGGNPNTHGAIAGSRPFWGPYMRGRYPNWGPKFFLDAAALVQ